MHKNIPVVEFELDVELGNISRIGNIFDYRHMPIGIEALDGKIPRKALNDWWVGRAIPVNRDGVKDVLQALDEYYPSILAAKCYGLSLSDQYWINPVGIGLKWKDVNFFENDFSEDMGVMLFGNIPEDMSSVSLISPDNTADGVLRKKWIIVNKKRVLMKGASNKDYKQEPFNEVIASALMRRLKISHVNYTLTFNKGRPYSLCDNFVTPNTELIPAWRVYKLIQKDIVDAKFMHMLDCCEKAGIVNIRHSLEQMLILDYIIMNEDRHFNNFGFIRDADTLEWKGFAPIFDSGSSLWYNTKFVGREERSRPFMFSHDEQLSLVSDLNWFDYKAFDGIEEECVKILVRSTDIDTERSEQLVKAIVSRCKNVEKRKQWLNACKKEESDDEKA
ncbi:MAG: hypothetical protein LBS29_04345 [Endomicrobium sp.]|jgi:hypothetical protein|nr:hypothetical protein [Endomicrobium sp.]